MGYKNIGIKEETILLLNSARGELQKQNPKRRFYDDDVIFIALTELIKGGENDKKHKRNTKRK